MTCTIPNCTQSIWTRSSNVDDLCRMHLRRKVKFGDPLKTSKPVRPRAEAVCKFRNCSKEALTRGYCQTHYKRKLREGALKKRSRYTPPAILTGLENRLNLLAVHRANPITQAINWR